ncbi:MAG: hypothetical protein HY841_01040 [Bacteroidetes bacterium]|nr:hypothetical protein [Bacteroidota bacterium]
MKTKINPRFIILLLLIVVAVAMRFITELKYSTLINFTPIGAVALFGGAYFSNRWKAILIPLLSLFISDLLINTLYYNGQFGIMYDGWYLVYGSFVLMVFSGAWIIKKVNIKNVLLASVVVSIAHWVITDFGVWLGTCTDITTGQLYTKDIQGLIKCYTLALPYMKSFFLGTICYSTIMFGAFELAQRKYPVLAVK